MPPAKTNRLASESSPYLRQHGTNPVDWYPWGREALDRARTEDRPILLSIGYSSCHWCHVMERESFENAHIADLMNDFFVNVKVDREERPDLDSIYMAYVQATTGHGGWPLTVFLTPEQVPFYGGTYFPPYDTGGRAGFGTVLKSVARFYQTSRSEVAGSRSGIADAITRSPYLQLKREEGLEKNLLDEAAGRILASLDPSHGGFGRAPKFPSAMTLSFLMRYSGRRRSSEAIAAVDLTLHSMARGGIHDQIGGGFHRYSVDDRWLVPHFEKMLYDNALLARSYLEGFQATGNGYYREVAKQALCYVQRDLTDPAGGFYSAEDADSEGEEGKFYVWDQQEIQDILGKDRSEILCAFYGVVREGNWEGVNILHRARDLASLARETGTPEDELPGLLHSAGQDLLAARSRRVRPGLDDKVLASWNGLVLTAFAQAGFLLGEESFVETARRNAEFIWNEMVVAGRLRRTWKEGLARLNAYLDDYAHVVEGFLELFQATGEEVWLERAIALMEVQNRLFWDGRESEFYLTSVDHEKLLIRPREHFDNATPAGASTSAFNLLILSHLTGDHGFKAQSEKLFLKMSGGMAHYPNAFSNWLRGFDFLIGPVKEVVVVGSPEEREPLVRVLGRTYLPRHVRVLADPGAAASSRLPLLEGRHPNRATAYVCEDRTCLSPTSNPEELARQLASA